LSEKLKKIIKKIFRWKKRRGHTWFPVERFVVERKRDLMGNVAIFQTDCVAALQL